MMKTNSLHIINNIDEARRVLNAYFDGTTSLAEEEALKKYLLSQPAFPADMEQDVRLFMDIEGLSSTWQQSQLTEAEALVPEGMDRRLAETLQKLASEQLQIGTTVEHVSEPMLRIGEKPPRSGFRLSYLVAACVACAVVLAIGLKHVPSDPKNVAQVAVGFTDTCSSPQEAEFQMNRALAMLNSKSQSGLGQANEHLENLSAAKVEISKYVTFD